MLAQLLLNIFIAFLWMLLIDEDHINASTFFAGFLVGIGIIFLMHRFFGTGFYLQTCLYDVQIASHLHQRTNPIKRARIEADTKSEAENPTWYFQT